ncbi:uncharacterized protein HMF8227_02911 [Saliniradius amylolyticus]|uniref:Diguanylate cyclase n=1 Tax=Saliniradius amylolyticus TaxID=2183582 RepID=A0A2S2E6X7_9ALTE|nr:uncharacterized protein HMF8227_02911 [Saliniradius amylolyticus]
MLLLMVSPVLAGHGVEPLVIESGLEGDEVQQHVQYLRAHRSARLSDVRHSQQWQKELDIAPLTPQEALWGRVVVQRLGGSESHFAFMFANPTVDELDLLLLDEQQRILQNVVTGAERRFDSRGISHRFYILALDLEPGDKRSLYFRIKDDGPLVVPLRLISYSDMLTQGQLNLALIGLIGGALFIMTCYFLLSYVAVRSSVRFWFSLSSLSFLLLFLNIEGILSQLTGVSTFVEDVSLLLVAGALFSSAKVAHLMLKQVPQYWRFISYLMAILLVVNTLLFNEYWQLVFAIGLAGAAIVVQWGVALAYSNREDGRPNLFYAIGWSMITLMGLAQTSLYVTGLALEPQTSLYLTLLLLLGLLLIAFAVEEHERAQQRSRHQQQSDTIRDLRRFYNLFRNSAEGLYTSTLSGKLVTTNPAMCKVFGYENEQQMLAECQTTAQFYAHEKDRLALVEELRQSGVVLGKEIEGVRRDGSHFWFSISVQLRHEHNEDYLFGTVFDITERKETNLSLEYMATHDPLTGVFNRREFERRLRSDLDEARGKGMPLTLIYMDLDQFKVVNDTCGHKAGDILIKQLSNQLNDVVEGHGLLARLGGDEFGVLLVGDEASEDSAYILANRLMTVVQEFRFVWEGRIFTLGISLGLVPHHEQIHTPEQLLSMADSACYMAKEQGRNQIHTYSREDEQIQRYETELHWVSLINEALEDDNFELFYQHYHPLNDLAHGHYYEILLRMNTKEGLGSPASFLPAAERYNLTAQVDRWVIEHFFRWLSDNPQHLAHLERANINLSGQSLGDKELRLFVLNAFEKYGIPYRKICFEITESMAIIKMDETLQFIRTFRKLGCTFALDDFGSGFSSYGYLKNLPVNYVKIDGSFVKDMLTDKVDMAMVRSIQEVAKAMDMETVAEFVETKDIMAELGKMGVDYAQGYGVAKPRSLKQFEPLIYPKQ